MGLGIGGRKGKGGGVPRSPHPNQKQQAAKGFKQESDECCPSGIHLPGEGGSGGVWVGSQVSVRLRSSPWAGDRPPRRREPSPGGEVR